MMISDFDTYCAFFSDWAAADNEVKFFLYGDTIQRMDAGYSDMEFPAMWLEEPEVHTQHNAGGDQYWDKYHTGLFFLTACDESVADTMAKSGEMYRLMGRFQKYLLEQDEAYAFIDHDRMIVKEALDPIFMTRVVGWRMSFDVKLNANVYLFDS